MDALPKSDNPFLGEIWRQGSRSSVDEDVIRMRVSLVDKFGMI